MNGPPAWKGVAAFVKDIAVEFQQRRASTPRRATSRPSPTSITDWSLCWDRSASRRLLDRRDVKTGRRMLTVVNPRYRFQLTRKGDRDPFKLESGKRFSPGSPQTYDFTEKQYRSLLEEGITIQFLTLGGILADREFRPTRAEYAPDGRAMVEWHYLGTENRVRSRHAGGNYWAELDPKRSWQTLRGGVRIPATGEEWSKEATYQPADGHVAFPETVKITLSTPRNKYRLETVFTLGKPGGLPPIRGRIRAPLLRDPRERPGISRRLAMAPDPRHRRRRPGPRGRALRLLAVQAGPLRGLGPDRLAKTDLRRAHMARPPRRRRRGRAHPQISCKLRGERFLLTPPGGSAGRGVMLLQALAFRFGFHRSPARATWRTPP